MVSQVERVEALHEHFGQLLDQCAKLRVELLDTGIALAREIKHADPHTQHDYAALLSQVEAFVMTERTREFH